MRSDKAHARGRVAVVALFRRVVRKQVMVLFHELEDLAAG